jgi:hypothetical protein
MAKDNSGLAQLAQTDPVLGYIAGKAFPQMVDFAKKNGKTPTWDDIEAPDESVVRRDKANTETGEREPIVDGAGNPINPARLAFAKAAAKYRPSANNKNANEALFRRIRTIAAKVNAASGIRRGRGGGTRLSDDDARLVVDMLDVAQLGV